MLRTIFLLASLMLGVQSAAATERWEMLPPTPAAIPSDRSGLAEVNGIRIHYAMYGQGSPVIFLHGGLANSDYWGHQVLPVAAHHTVILMDSRGHGRSTRDDKPFGYDLMADDVVALMDHLKIARADIVGWSDGAILGIDLAMRHQERVGKVFAFAGNTTKAGLKEDFDQNPVFAAYLKRAGEEYTAQSATPKQYEAFVEQIGKMWATQPNWTDADLKTIDKPMLVIDGDHDEGIRREHTEYIAATIPRAQLVILADTSHFAFLQDPATFNAVLLKFLDGHEQRGDAGAPTQEAFSRCQTVCAGAGYFHDR
ncbi:MAG: alpha/beta hydrolase [Tardiphaga sp.]